MEMAQLRRERLAEGRVALVTGAGSGIGQATALLFAEEGADAVVVADVSRRGARETATLVEEQGAKALCLEVDVASASAVDSMVSDAMSAFQRIDYAVNNAGISGNQQRLGDYADGDWRSVMDVNLDGVFYCMRAEIRAMEKGGGSIVNISSGATADPVPLLSAYTASKSGVIGMTKAAAGEYTRHNIRMNAVLPGPIKTPMRKDVDPAEERSLIERMPMQRLGTPTELAQAVVWLCSWRASFVHGATLLVDGGTHAFSW